MNASYHIYVQPLKTERVGTIYIIHILPLSATCSLRQALLGGGVVVTCDGTVCDVQCQH